MEVSRDDMIARIHSFGAQDIFVVAPAGYGSSMSTHQLLPGFESAAICALAGARVKAAVPRVEIRVLSGDAFIDGKPVRMTPSEFAIVAVLARQQRPYDSEQLCEELYPELDGKAAQNRLYLYVHRARQRLGSAVIIGTKSGYVLGPTISADIREAKDLVDACKNASDKIVTEDGRVRLATLAPLTRAELIALGTRARLPNPLTYHLEDLRRSVLLVRADDALARQDLAETMKVADALVADDPGDEEGYGYRIRALLLLGNRAAAIRVWSHCRGMLEEHLGVAPTPFEHYLSERPYRLEAVDPPRGPAISNRGRR